MDKNSWVRNSKHLKQELKRGLNHHKKASEHQSKKSKQLKDSIQSDRKYSQIIYLTKI